MTWITPLLALQTLNAPTSLFDASLAAHRALDPVDVNISVGLTKPTQSLTRYRVRIDRPDRARIDLFRESTPRINQSYLVVGRQLVALDHVREEYIPVRRQTTSNNLVRVFAELLDTIDEPVAFILDPAAYGTFLSRMKKTPNWTVRTLPGVTLASQVAPTQLSTLRFDAKTKRLVGVGGTGVGVEFKYNPIRPIPLTVPKSYRSVTGFRNAAEPASYATPKARQIVQASVRAYRRLNSIEYDAISEIGSASVSFDRGRFSQTASGRDTVAYDGQTLYVVERRAKQFRRIRADRRQALAILDRRSFDLDSKLRRLINGENPVEMYLRADTKVREVGSLILRGRPASIVEFRGRGYKLLITLLTSGGWIAGSETQTLDLSGRILTKRSLTYTIYSTNQPLGDRRFRLMPPTGFKVVTTP